MITKSSPVMLTPEEQAYISRLNECERRHFLATKAILFHKEGLSISKVSKIMKVSKNTIYKAIRELSTGDGPGPGRVRRQGGGRKSLLSLHPE